MSDREKRKEKQLHTIVAGVSREAEEVYLADTIMLAQRNLENARAGVKKLSGDVDAYMKEVNATGEKDSLLLWNNAKAQLKEAINEISRHEKARKKPYFGRIDFTDAIGKKEESYYIGRVGIARENKEPAVIDWRTPVASVYYENAMGKGTYTVSSEGTFEIDLKRKRSYEIENDTLKDFYDLDVVANDDLLTKYLSKNKTEVLGEIIATIQKEQNRIIRRSPKTNMIVQGVAGSGKTTVAMHRISYILYNYEGEFRPEDFYIIGSNRILLNYITSVLPDLDVYGVSQMTMEQLFIRLLYEDWDDKKYSIRNLDKSDERNSIKGSKEWYSCLARFCDEYEAKHISSEEVYMEKTGTLLVGKNLVETYRKENPLMSMQSKILMLNEILYAKYENEVLGKNVSFLPEEKKILDKKYSTFYGKNDWKGSIYELYWDFLLTQKADGYDIDIYENSFDVYDLAALAYLYKRIKEIDPIREATHIVIDEAQDFGMMAYHCLSYCMRGCTYTIMGDTSQNIHFSYGLNDWDELKELILTGTYDKFGLLRKSYRNTVEISNFATEILKHGDFSIYPVEPIIRHGNEVRIEKCSSKEELLAQSVKTIKGWQEEGYETIAVICRDDEEARNVSKELQKYIQVKETDLERAEFGSGVLVLPVIYTKGLEFDAVLIYDPTEDNYPANNGHVKMLYVTATRALHELAVLHQGELSTIIASKVDKDMELFSEETDLSDEEKRPVVTQKEIMEQRKVDGRHDMEERNYIGPKRIVLKAEQQAKKVSPVDMNNRYVESLTGEKIETVKAPASTKNVTTKIPAKQEIVDDRPINTSKFSYGEIPDNHALAVNGHSKADLAVRWVKKNKTAVEIASRYGILTITPIAEECVRITFVKGQLEKATENYWKTKPKAGLKWTAKESPSLLEIAVGKLIVQIQKKDGAIRFLSSDKKLLLAERAYDARLIDGNETWNFFDFDKKEKLKAKGILAEDMADLSLKAKYISFGKKQMRMPLVLSDKGYGIGVASEKTVLFCGIPAYGPYIYTEGCNQIDYFFFHGIAKEKILAMYRELQ